MRYWTVLGLLVLLGAISAAAQKPPGTYQQSCKNIKAHHETLTARCKDMSGHWVNTSLDRFDRCNTISNVNGQLHCDGRNGDRDRDRDRDHDRDRDRGQNNPPPGSYTQTCRQISVRGDTLRAECETRDGRWTRTQLNDWDRCHGISNDNGQLRCDR